MYAVNLQMYNHILTRWLFSSLLNGYHHFHVLLFWRNSVGSNCWSAVGCWLRARRANQARNNRYRHAVAFSEKEEKPFTLHSTPLVSKWVEFSFCIHWPPLVVVPDRKTCAPDGSDIDISVRFMHVLWFHLDLL